MISDLAAGRADIESIRLLVDFELLAWLCGRAVKVHAFTRFNAFLRFFAGDKVY